MRKGWKIVLGFGPGLLTHWKKSWKENKLFRSIIYVYVEILRIKKQDMLFNGVESILLWVSVCHSFFMVFKVWHIIILYISDKTMCNKVAKYVRIKSLYGSPQDLSDTSSGLVYAKGLWEVFSGFDAECSWCYTRGLRQDMKHHNPPTTMELSITKAWESLKWSLYKFVINTERAPWVPEVNQTPHVFTTSPVCWLKK